MATKATKNKYQSTLGRTEDKTVQITFTIPWKEIQSEQSKVLDEITKEATIPGFRKGMAPKAKVQSTIDNNVVVDKVLNSILPGMVSTLINEHKIKPAIYPKVELVKVEEGEDWQIRIITCELPEVVLGDYKKAVRQVLNTKAIWTPQQGKDSVPKEKSKEEKEQQALQVLLENVKMDIPKLLIHEEVDSRLSQLLQRLEKLGISLENYLASTTKTVDQLRKDYEQQAAESIKMELILNKIAQEEDIKVEQSQIDEVVKASSADPAMQERLSQPEQRRLIESVLLRRGALEKIASL